MFNKVVGHSNLVNFIRTTVRCRHPENREKKFNIKKKQKLVTKFQAYKSFGHVNLTTLAYLKKDLPINMKDEHPNGERMILFYKEKEEVTLKKKDDPFHRQYFKFHYDSQIPYRLGHEENEELAYDRFQNTEDRQKFYNFLIFNLDNFYNKDNPVLEITHPESFVGHFDAVVHTHRTLTDRFRLMKNLYSSNRRRFNNMHQAWFSEKFMNMFIAVAVGYNFAPFFKFRAAHLWDYLRKIKKFYM